MDLNTYLEQEGKGSAVKLAKGLNLSPVLISQWRTGKRSVPAEHCPSIERETGGKVRCEDLHPDVDWGYLRASLLSTESVQQDQP